MAVHIIIIVAIMSQTSTRKSEQYIVYVHNIMSLCCNNFPMSEFPLAIFTHL